jgi:tetratricopeptide (TPR) repeat protein
MEDFNNSDDKLNKIEKIIRDSYHPTSDELGNYILYKNGIDPEDKSILRLVPKIELHLRRCSECNSLFLELNNEYSDIDNFLKVQEPFKIDNISEHIKIPVKPIIKTPVRYFNFKFSGIVIVLACVLYFGAFSVSKLLTPSSVKYAHLESTSDLFETRGRVTHDFQESLKALENRDYEATVNWLNKDIVYNRGDETIFYSYYILGLAYLESAQTDIIGLFPSYDKTKVNQGISAFNKALELNNSGKFRNINLDIYFFLAKADFMLNNISGAKENLKKVVTEKGSNMNEAKKILSGLD